MKIRTDFVTNSSSSSFIITNTSDKELTLYDFVSENPHLIHQFNEEYGNKYTINEVLQSIDINTKFKPSLPTECVFGDEDGTAIGHVFDYILRSGGKSDNFKWRFKEYLR